MKVVDVVEGLGCCGRMGESGDEKEMMRRPVLSRQVSKAAVEEASKRRRASLGLVNIQKSQRLAVELGEGDSSEGTAGSCPSQIALLPKFKLSDIDVGRVLKRGSSGSIREIRSRRGSCGGTLASSDSSNVDDDEPDQQFARDKKLLADSLHLEGSTDARYVIKVGAHVAVFVIPPRFL